jgi:hypothetical protein
MLNVPWMKTPAVRPHTTLQGKTLAEVAGIGIDGQNKRKELLKMSLSAKEP